MKNTLLLLAVFFSLALCADDVPLACKLGALTPAERAQHASLTGKLFSAVTTRNELARGYSFQLDRTRISVAEVKSWTGLEGRCCPFIEFAIEEGQAPAPIVLRLSGKAAVKKFIAAELGEAGLVPPAK